ncbi:YfcL family protein [Thalassomonas sp. M1454]|uniref:YfcL family protein n=1 Tax=Thalassomonas sp. M1454 TaxID=2594477 RepID=UPI00117F0001|nr:YfcL family protein [Thalassomonas sp. M1454]TRX57282.1 YfcL family protein [Thalassomonas sp. M1454]
MNLENVKTVADLCQYFDSLIDHDDDDLLFASSYVRGFLVVAAVEFGDEQQALTNELYDLVTSQLDAARSELTPRDKVIVDNFWSSLKTSF